MFVGLKQNVNNFHQFLTCSNAYGMSDVAEDQMKVIFTKNYSLKFTEINNINIKTIKGIFQFLCCKNNKSNLQTQESFIKTFDSWHLFPFTSTWMKLFVSLCSVANSDQLIEIYLLDKNTKDISYHQVVAELKQNQNLSVMLVSSNTLVGYRCNHHHLNNAPNINGSLETIVLRYCLINDDIANTLSSYLINSHDLKRLAITECTVKSDHDQLPLVLVLQVLRRNSTITYLNLGNTKISGPVAKELANVIKNNFNLQQLGLANCYLGPSAIVILQALKENSQLKALNLNSNNMTGQVAEDLVHFLQNNSNLQKLGLENNNLGLFAIVILQALKENSQLKALNLNSNNMTGQIAEDLAIVIKNNSGLEELYLYDNDLKSSATVILQALKENSRLKVLNLNSNNMTGQVAEDLANVIKNNSGLEELYLSNNNLGPSATVILQALKEKRKIKILYLHNNKITGQVAEDFVNFLKNNSNLQKLGLENNNLGLSATVILQALKENSQLKALNLNSNNMTGQVAEDLANVIKNNSGLEELYLSNNNLGPSATVILQALKEKRKIKILYLHNNKITGQVAEDLAHFIKNNFNLQELGLENNNLESSATVILQALKENSQLKVLNLNSNSMTGQVTEDLANVIKNNLGLEELYLNDNDLKSSATVILQALKENSQLEVLNLSRNNMTGQVAEDLANVIKNNSGLEELYLYDNDLKLSATVILQALKENSQLKVLHLNYSNMIGQVAEHLANIIKTNSKLEKLYLGNNNLGPSATVILQALKENSQLKLLNCDLICKNPT